MCAICGCGQPEHGHAHDHRHDHHHEHGLRAHGAEARWLRIEEDILGKNNRYAAENRAYFRQNGIFALNFVSSPGAGKTSLLVATIRALKERIPIAVIEGDQQTHRDADRIRAEGVPALQINTGKACHLDAHGVGHAVADLQARPNSLLAIENVGNLVCPSSFDLGEAHKVVILSVTEGDDKSLKYPDMFRAADLMVINKIDLLPYVDFDVSRCIDYAREVNPEIGAIRLSATRGDGLDEWVGWIVRGIGQSRIE
ncbi:hydrogenase nickel incorporation protein HypB [Methylocaldum sp. MU1018]